MFVGDSADTFAGKFPLVSMGGRAEGLACADPGARAPIGLEANEGANISHDQNLILVIMHIEKHNITEIIEN